MSYSRDVNLFSRNARCVSADQAVFSLEFYPEGGGIRVLYGTLDAVSAFRRIANRLGLACASELGLVFPSDGAEDFDGNFWLTGGEIYLAKLRPNLVVRRVDGFQEVDTFWQEVSPAAPSGISWSLVPYDFSTLDQF